MAHAHSTGERPDTRPETGRLAAKQAERRRRVIKTAMDMAAEGGYDGVQMRDVAAKAGVALGTLYRYFTSKDQLLSEALVEWVGELEDNLGRRPPTSGSKADRAVDILRRASRAIERNPRLASAMIKAATTPDAAEPRPMRAGRSFHALLEDALDDERPEDRDRIIHVLDLVWFGLVVRWMSGQIDARTMGDDLEMAARLVIR